MISVNIFNRIKDAFGGLWATKQRGNTMEIITPFATTNNKFVSVFLSYIAKEYVITDGGWVSNGLYLEEGLPEDSNFRKALFHFQNSFGVSEVTNRTGALYYYLKVDNEIDIPSAVFDLSTFIQNVISIAEVNFEDKKEKDLKKRFNALANDYIGSIIPKGKLKFNAYLNPDKKDLRFNIIYNISRHQIYLVNYITGSTNSHFTSSIFKTNTLFEMADQSLLGGNIGKKISLIDNTAEGFDQERLAHFLLHINRFDNSKQVNWSSREELKALLN